VRLAGVLDGPFGHPLSHSRLRCSIPVCARTILLSTEYLPRATVRSTAALPRFRPIGSMLSRGPSRPPGGKTSFAARPPDPPRAIYLGSSILLFRPRAEPSAEGGRRHPGPLVANSFMMAQAWMAPSHAIQHEGHHRLTRSVPLKALTRFHTRGYAACRVSLRELCEKFEKSRSSTLLGMLCTGHDATRKMPASARGCRSVR
jgi:hypothetical protein